MNKLTMIAVAGAAALSFSSIARADTGHIERPFPFGTTSDAFPDPAGPTAVPFERPLLTGRSVYVAPRASGRDGSDPAILGSDVDDGH